MKACTGIEDVAEAIFHLDETNWDLLVGSIIISSYRKSNNINLQRAVSRVMPPDTQSFQPRPDPDVMVVEDDGNLSSIPLERATDMMEVGNNVGHPRPKKPSPENSIRNQDSYPSTSGSSGNERMLKFNITYCDRVIKIELPESGTVSK